MVDAALLSIGGLLATLIVLTDPVMVTRLAVAMSFGVLVGIYFWAVLPYHRQTEGRLAVDLSLDIFD